ncbi:MAG TPA: MAPEG family protein [Gammaproteobacteria bacterium]|nr:MAPEG family protein [Gammaproteobacteria bacterium]
MSVSLTALLGFASWTLLLLILMAFMRVGMVLSGRKQPHEFAPDGSDMPPFGQRLTRAHANCLENLPIFGALILVAVFSGKTSVTDPLALWFLLARVLQSLVHLIRVNAPMVNLRFLFYLAQVAIMVYYAWFLFF